MYLQPVFGFKTGFNKAEALARLVTATGNIIYPDKFLFGVSHTRLFELGLVQVMQYLLCTEGIAISINLQMDHLPAVIKTIEKAVNDLSHGRLIIELLENKNEFALPVDDINRLKAAGVQIAMDDFGSGHSSILRALAVQFDYIKIDRYLLHCLQTTNLLKNVVNISKDLGCETIVEGVENQDMLAVAHNAGAEYVQGFGIAKPMPFKEFLVFMDNSEKKSC